MKINLSEHYKETAINQSKRLAAILKIWKALLVQAFAVSFSCIVGLSIYYWGMYPWYIFAGCWLVYMNLVVLIWAWFSEKKFGYYNFDVIYNTLITEEQLRLYLKDYILLRGLDYADLDNRIDEKVRTLNDFIISEIETREGIAFLKVLLKQRNYTPYIPNKNDGIERPSTENKG